MCNKELQGNQQKYCSGNCKVNAHNKRVREQPNTYHSQTIRGLKRKVKLVKLLGGKCSNCGYSKNLAALEFNHLDPNKKELQLDLRSLSNHREEILLKEVKKCNLLCSNCHKEHHYKEMEFDNVLTIIGS